MHFIGKKDNVNTSDCFKLLLLNSFRSDAAPESHAGKVDRRHDMVGGSGQHPATGVRDMGTIKAARRNTNGFTFSPKAGTLMSCLPKRRNTMRYLAKFLQKYV